MQHQALVALWCVARVWHFRYVVPLMLVCRAAAASASVGRVDGGTVQSAQHPSGICWKWALSALCLLFAVPIDTIGRSMIQRLSCQMHRENWEMNRTNAVVWIFFRCLLRFDGQVQDFVSRSCVCSVADLIFSPYVDVDRQQVFKLSCLKNRFLLLSCIYYSKKWFWFVSSGFSVFTMPLELVCVPFSQQFYGFTIVIDMCGNDSPSQQQLIWRKESKKLEYLYYYQVLI